MKSVRGTRMRCACGVLGTRAAAVRSAPGGIAARFASWLARRVSFTALARARRASLTHPRRERARHVVAWCATPTLAARSELGLRVELLFHVIAAQTSGRDLETRVARRSDALPSRKLHRALRWASPARLRVRDGRGTERRRAASRGDTISSTATKTRAATAELAKLDVPGLPIPELRAARPREVVIAPRLSVALPADSKTRARPGSRTVERRARNVSSDASAAAVYTDAESTAPLALASGITTSETQIVLERRRTIAAIESAILLRVSRVSAIKRSSAQTISPDAVHADRTQPRAELRGVMPLAAERVAFQYATPTSSEAATLRATPGRDIGRELEELRTAVARRPEPAPVHVPQVDIAALGRQVRNEIERHVRIERERRGR